MTGRLSPVPGFKDYYALDTGGVVSEKWGKLRLLIPHSITGGYHRIRVCKDGASSGQLVHRMVALAFVPNPENKPEVNHKDGNKLNNRADNLEWCTRGENLSHSYRVIGNSHPRHKAVKCIERNKIYSSIRKAAEDNSMDSSSICKALYGKQITSGGYHWELVS